MSLKKLGKKRHRSASERATRHQKKTRPVKLARSHVSSKAAELLFRELVKELLQV